MEFIGASELTYITQKMKEKSVNVDLVQTTMAEPVHSAVFLTDDEFVVNLVGGMEEGVLTTIDQDILKVTTEPMYSDLIHFDDQDITTLVPMAASQAPETPDSWTYSPAPSTKTPDSWTYSPAPSTNSEDSEPTSPLASTIISPSTSPGYEMCSPMSEASSSSDESITLVVSPEDVFGEQCHPKRKRGRKPKSETGTCAPPRAKKARKTKVYEIDQPFEDKDMERKRLNAVNAKRHRELQRQNKEALEQQLEDVKSERDGLKKQVETLREKEVSLTQQLEVFKKHFGNQALSVVTLLQAGQVSF